MEFTLWRDIQRGDADAFAALYRMHANAIYRYLFRRTASWDLSEDLAAQVFLEAWRKRHEVICDVDAGLLPWLYGVAGNVLRNHRRAETRRDRFTHAFRLRDVTVDFTDEVDTRLDDEQAMQAIRRLIHELPIGDQEVLRLCLWEGLTPGQAAIALGISSGAARTRLSRAKQHIQALARIHEASRLEVGHE